MRVIESKVYTIEDHPNKSLCFDWMRDNWHDINRHSVDEIIESINALSKIIGGTFDYSISQVPDRGEHVTFKGYNKEALYMLSADSCPLTGASWDTDLIQGLKEGTPSKVLDALHEDTEYQYSDEGLSDMCEASGLEFHESGEVF